MVETASLFTISSASVKSLAFTALAPTLIMPTSMTEARARLRVRLRFLMFGIPPSKF